MEFDNGWLEVLLFAGTRIRVSKRKYREPDIVFVATEHADQIGERFWTGADLVMEVVSTDEKDRERDVVTKRDEYAKAKIREYWMVDPDRETITVLRLSRGAFMTHGEFHPGETATSKLLTDFTADVTMVLTPPGAKKRNGAKRKA